MFCFVFICALFDFFINLLLTTNTVTPQSLLRSPVLGKFSDDEDDDCDEDLTPQQRVAWRAKQEDLNNMRKGESEKT